MKNIIKVRLTSIPITLVIYLISCAILLILEVFSIENTKFIYSIFIGCFLLTIYTFYIYICMVMKQFSNSNFKIKFLLF